MHKKLVLFKFYEDRKFADDFARGRLYCNSFRYFATLDGYQGGRRDFFEGRNYIHPRINNRVVISLEDGQLELDADQLSLRRFRDSTYYNNKLFSFYSFRRDDFLSRESFFVDSRILQMGDYVVYITDGDEFFRRLRSYFVANNILYSLSSIEYIDTNNYSGPWNYFRKPIEYQYQNEYRIVFNDNLESPRIIDLGDLSHIVEIKTLEEFLDYEIQLFDDERVDSFTLRENLI